PDMLSSNSVIHHNSPAPPTVQARLAGKPPGQASGGPVEVFEDHGAEAVGGRAHRGLAVALEDLALGDFVAVGADEGEAVEATGAVRVVRGGGDPGLRDGEVHLQRLACASGHREGGLLV